MPLTGMSWKHRNVTVSESSVFTLLPQRGFLALRAGQPLWEAQWSPARPAPGQEQEQDEAEAAAPGGGQHSEPIGLPAHLLTLKVSGRNSLWEIYLRKSRSQTYFISFYLLLKNVHSQGFPWRT